MEALQMKNTKKGFTLVELLVVIAILAILATVSVVGYTSFIERANRSADQQLVAQLNVVVVGYLVENPNPTAQDIQAQLAQNGVSQFTLAHKGHTMFWDAQTKRIVLVEGNQIVYPEQCKRALSNDEISNLDVIRYIPEGEVYFELLAISVDSQNKVDQQVTFGSSGDFAKAVVPTGVQVNDGTQTLSLAVAVTERQANVQMNSGEVSYSLDVHVEGVASNNDVPVLVTLNGKLPTGLASNNVKLYHVENSQTIEMTSVASLAEVDQHNEFFYNAQTGDVTLAMASFSEVTAVVAVGNPWDGSTVDTSWYNKDATEFVLTNAEQFAGFAQIVGGMASGIERDSFAGKTVKLGANLNMGSAEGKIFTPVGYYFTNDNNNNGIPNENAADIYADLYCFEGTFDGQGYTIANVYQSTWEIKGDDKYYSLPSKQYYNDGMGIFGWVHNGTIQNLAVNNFQSDGEFCTTGCVSAYASGATNFQNIRIYNSNPRAYNVPNGGVVGYAYDEENVTNSITFENVTVDPTTKISALWGSWDVSCGGILGRLGNTTKLTMSNCTTGAIMDVYNDVCGNYQYYQYRYSGMLVGTLGSDGDLDDQLANATFENVSIYYGDWATSYNYYCELVENSIASYTHDYQFSRLEMINSIEQIKSGGEWLKTGNFVLVENGVATCYHIRKNAEGTLYQHNHADEGYETIDGEQVLVEDKQVVHIPFNQLFSGYGWGADHQVDLANVAQARYTVTFLTADGNVLDVQYVTADGAIAVDGIDDTAIALLEMGDTFGGWHNLGGDEITEISAENTKNIVLYATQANTYYARWLDEDGNVLVTQAFNENTFDTNVKGYTVEGPASKSDFLTFGYWAVRNADKTSTPLKDYKFSDSDITIYPYYNVIADGTASMTLQGVDTDGDGHFDHYVVTGVDETDENINVEIPDYINGLPVIEVTGGAFAEFDNITTVKIPTTITSIGADAFANKEGIILKYEQITFLYEGTYEQWKAIAKDANWDRYVGQGSRIYFLADGTYSEETARNGTFSASARVWSDPVAGTYEG